MKLRLPSLGNVMKDALKNGAVAKRFQVTQDEVKWIRRAEAAGGHDSGLRFC